MPMLQPCRSIASCSGEMPAPLQCNGLPAQVKLLLETLLILLVAFRNPEKAELNQYWYSKQTVLCIAEVTLCA